MKEFVILNRGPLDGLMIAVYNENDIPLLKARWENPDIKAVEKIKGRKFGTSLTYVSEGIIMERNGDITYVLPCGCVKEKNSEVKCKDHK